MQRHIYSIALAPIKMDQLDKIDATLKCKCISKRYIQKFQNTNMCPAKNMQSGCREALIAFAME